MTLPSHLGNRVKTAGDVHHNAPWMVSCARIARFLVFLLPLLLPGCGGAKPAGVREAAFSVDELRERLKSEKAAERLGAVQGIRRQGIQAAGAVDDVIALLKTENDITVRQSAAQALGFLGQAKAVPALIRLLQTDPDDVVRRQAAAALGNLGAMSQPAVAVLRQVAGSDAPIVRQAADEALVKIQGKMKPELTRPRN